MKAFLTSLKSDESLMLDYQNGDSVAFEVLYQRHKDKLFNFIYRSCRNPEVVEDVAHEVWIAVIRNIDSYQPKAKFTTYLYQITRNKIIDHGRRQKSKPIDGVDDDVDFENLSRQDGLHSLQPSAGHDADNQLEWMHLLNQLMDALARLPDEQREAFLLKEQGFNQKEIADITETTPETVKSRVRYARKSLKQTLGAVT